ncbi:MAG: flagellar protein [Lachnospiraceae bacterium]|nr:flagellar protein [Lachnospiraceae bacterium]
MNVRNCKNCGRLFNYIAGPPICPECKDQIEKKFQQAKEFVRNTPHATVSMVAEEVDVPEQQVKQWIREERLVFADSAIAGIACEVCGEPISTGRFCAKCKNQVMNDLNGAIKRPDAPVIKKKERENPRMRFLDNR